MLVKLKSSEIVKNDQQTCLNDASGWETVGCPEARRHKLMTVQLLSKLSVSIVRPASWQIY